MIDTSQTTQPAMCRNKSALLCINAKDTWKVQAFPGYYEICTKNRHQQSNFMHQKFKCRENLIVIPKMIALDDYNKEFLLILSESGYRNTQSVCEECIKKQTFSYVSLTDILIPETRKNCLQWAFVKYKKRNRKKRIKFDLWLFTIWCDSKVDIKYLKFKNDFINQRVTETKNHSCDISEIGERNWRTF